MSRAPLDVALDAALDALAAGAPIEACLAAWPEHRVALEPALRAAEQARALRLAHAAPDPARRAAFMAQLHATPQQQPHRLDASLRAAKRAFAALGQRGLLLAPAAAVVAAALFVTLGRNAPPAEASTLTIFGGAVELADGAAWRPLADSAQLPQGARLRTSSAGRAVLTFEDGSTVALEPDTELTIERLRTAGARAIALRLAYGRLWHDVAPAGGDPPQAANSSYLVHTPDATVTAHGTRFETAVAGGETAVSTLEGSVELRRNGERVLVQHGETARAQQHRPLAPPQRQQPPALGVAVEAPFAASLIAPDGRATGARLDGLLYHQISGATTSDPAAGAQRIALAHPEPGAYTLLLRRIGPGDGALLFAANGDERRVPLDATLDALAVRLQVELIDGRTVVTPQRVAPATGGQVERLIVTERARLRAAELLRLREQRRSETASPGADPSATSPARPTLTPRPAAEPTRVLPTLPARTPLPTRIAPTPPATRNPLAPIATSTRPPATAEADRDRDAERTPTPPSR